MESSLESTHTSGEVETLPATQREAAEDVEAEHHIHLPNPSMWPLLLGAAILLTIIGLMFIPANPWLLVVGAVLILIGIMGFGLEDPMGAPKDAYIASPVRGYSRFALGQEVVDKYGQQVGTIQARFARYVLVESGGLFGSAFYVPTSLIEETVKDNVIHLMVSEDELSARDLNHVPADLYDDAPEPDLPSLKGIPMFARGPLSPAETGHYNYGPNYPGINTDASGSYIREEVVPTPQKYIADRRKLRATSKNIPSRAISSN